MKISKTSWLALIFIFIVVFSAAFSGKASGRRRSRVVMLGQSEPVQIAHLSRRLADATLIRPTQIRVRRPRRF